MRRNEAQNWQTIAPTYCIKRWKVSLRDELFIYKRLCGYMTAFHTWSSFILPGKRSAQLGCESDNNKGTQSESGRVKQIGKRS